ncbi:bifunctional riboflavin kinase/FAD synthetase [Prevotella aurantiaca]
MKTIFLEGINKDELTLEKPVVATIGFFDGVHLGHQFLINRLAEMAKQENLESMVITFDCHPRQVLQSNYQPRMLSTLEEKLEKLEKTASDHIVVLHFDKALAQLTSKQFMESILRERLNVRKLMMGYDNRFGHNRTETFDDYVIFGKEIGIEVCKNTALSMGNFNVSSSVIRQFIETGNMEEATRCLGVPYSLSGKIVGGYQNGRKLGYPTANIDIRKTDKLLPAMGVYAVQVRIENNEKIYGGMLNIGTRPTFNGSDLSVEVYIFDFSGNLYDRTIEVFFMSRVRSERIFPTLEALAEQMQLDEQQIRTILKDQ